MSYPISSLAFLVYQSVPMVFGQENTLLETVAAVVAKVNELITDSNAYFSTDVSTIINARLTTWQADGTLAGMINEALQTDLDTFMASQTVKNAEMDAALDAVETALDSRLDSVESSLVSALSNISAVESSAARITGMFYNVKWSGEAGEGTKEDTYAIQATINAAQTAGGGIVFFPAGVYKVKRQVGISAPGITLQGVGKEASIISVHPDYNLSAAAVIAINNGEPGAIIRDLGITFVQPDTVVRASLVAYPPAIYVNGPRSVIQNIKIQGAMHGIALIGNAGGTSMENISMSAFTRGITMDGCMDSVRVKSLHFWPFGLSGNQASIMTDSTNIALVAGRADDLKISDCTFWCGKAIQFYNGTVPGSEGAPFGEITGCDFDNCYGIEALDGNFTIVGSLFTSSRVTDRFLYVTAGSFALSGCSFYAASYKNEPMVMAANAAAESMITITGCKFGSGPHETSMIGSSGYGRIVVMGCTFDRDPGFSWTKPTIDISAGILVLMGCYSKDKGAGAGNVFAACAGDVRHRIIGNCLPGWAITTTGSLPIVEHN